MLNIGIRTAVGGDCAAVLEVMRAAFATYETWLNPPSGSRNETVASLEKRLEQGPCFVAEVDGAVVGCVFCERHDNELYFGRLSVSPAWQGAGIGGRLLAAVENFARQEKVERLTLGVRIVLTDNVHFFKRQGFVIYGEGTHEGFDAPTYYKMEKKVV